MFDMSRGIHPVYNVGQTSTVLFRITCSTCTDWHTFADNLTPYRPETHHFLSAEEFEILHKSNPNGTFIANISRGGIIDQPALIKALEMQQIRGAALDVTDPEPLPSDDPLWSAPNVLITPHVSGGSVEYVPRAFEVLKENLRRRRDGGKLVNEVDRKRGY